MGKFIREKQSPDKVPNDIQKFLKEAFGLYAWRIKEGSNMWARHLKSILNLMRMNVKK